MLIVEGADQFRSLTTDLTIWVLGKLSHTWQVVGLTLELDFSGSLKLAVFGAELVLLL